MAMPNAIRDDLARWTTCDPQAVAPTSVDFMPSRLTLRLLGEIDVVRDGEPLVLPSSRKARALLAYLTATNRTHRRSRLCALLWDIPDDPRGALRSALSKLRAVVDEPGRQRIVADRDTVRFDATGVEIDVAMARSLLASGGDDASTPALEAAEASFRGEFAEGLALSNCPDFHAWCVAEREETRRLHVGLLWTLLERHQAAPEAALPYARTLVRIAPNVTAAHAALLRFLFASGRRREAEEQRDLSLRALAEVGNGAVTEITLAWRALAARPAAATAPPATRSPAIRHSRRSCRGPGRSR